nr:hypothetical protein DCAR_025336 [Ipomoea trifida]GMC53192.1 tricalbin-3-like [Ipomoea batatas]GMC86859.1 tricalbin-3-like [Ipomoea batatas]GMD43661.1 tricalbin-3-like [Ipomoea batatas]GMD88492.1 tricalbin-3-like [Ipomoea batatas]
MGSPVDSIFHFPYFFACVSFTKFPCHPGKTDPYVILRLGDQVIRSKRNSQTTVIGPPGEPIWNQVRFYDILLNTVELMSMLSVVMFISADLAACFYLSLPNRIFTC